MKSILDTEECKEWLRRFAPEDLVAAKWAALSLRIIPLQEVERACANFVKKLEALNVSVNLLFVNDPLDSASEYSSEHRLGHIIKCQSPPERIVLNATPDMMRGLKTRRVYVIQDYIGSGAQIEKFWRKYLEGYEKTLASWVSYRKIKLGIFSVVSSVQGLRRAMESMRFAAAEDVHTSYVFPGPANFWHHSSLDLFKKYSKRYQLGYGGSGMGVVLAYRAPNNLPGVFWFKPKGAEYEPLFPMRKVPDAIQTLSQESPAGNLFPLSGPLLSRPFEILNAGASDSFRKCVSVLRLLQAGVKRAELANYCVMTEQELTSSFQSLLDSHLIGPEGGLTAGGKLLLLTSGKQRSTEREVPVGRFSREAQFYYPTNLAGS